MNLVKFDCISSNISVLVLFITNYFVISSRILVKTRKLGALYYSYSSDSQHSFLQWITLINIAFQFSILSTIIWRCPHVSQDEGFLAKFARYQMETKSSKQSRKYYRKFKSVGQIGWVTITSFIFKLPLPTR